MIKIKNWVNPESIDEAYEILNQRINNRVLGGGAFLRLAHDLTIDTAVNLSNLGLDRINEEEEDFEIGAMTTLRQLEVHEGLNNQFSNIFKLSLENIVGVQLRNIATIGGTLFSKYGFSDLITALMALDTTLVFHKLGEIRLDKYLKMPRAHKRDAKDILIKVKIKKQDIKCSFKMLRNSTSDFAMLNASVSKADGFYKIVVGARPGVACYAEEAMRLLNANVHSPNALNIGSEKEMASILKAVSQNLEFGSNRFGNKAYRIAMSELLVKRALVEVTDEN